MKKIILLIFLTIALGGTAYYVVKKNKALKYTSGVTPDRDFAIKSMDGITNIVIKHAKLQPIQFQKKGDTWVINNKFEANKTVVANLTNVLTKMQLKFTPSRATNATVKNDIKRSGIKVQLYAGEDKPVKSYYIATDTGDNEGTYMMMEGAEQAYVMHMPALGGFRSRFEQPLSTYRDVYIIKEPKENIASITIQYPKNDASSFVVDVNGDNSSIRSMLPNMPKATQPLNMLKLNSFIGNFAKLGTEGLMENFEHLDDLLKTIPFATIQIKRKNGSSSKFTFFVYEEFLEGSKTSKSPIDMPNIQRYFLYDDKGELYVCQNTVFKKIFMDYTDFYR